MNQVVCILGPTASGKTDLAIALQETLPVEIISVDSAQIYNDLNIGSGKPTRAELEKAPHHLIDIINPDQSYSAAKFQSTAIQLIDDILSRGKTPLLVGGTMMYFKSLQAGIHALPAADPILRLKLEAQGEALGWSKMHQTLQAVDPISAERIKVNDRQRIQRALEVFYLTDTPLSSHLLENRQPSGYHFLNFALTPKDTPRSVLHARINQRFQRMLDQGLVEELMHVREKYELHKDLPSMRSVGYRQVWAYLEKQWCFETMRDKAMTATRQLAKRQLTWLRSWPNVIELDMLNESNLDLIIQNIDANHDQGSKITDCV